MDDKTYKMIDSGKPPFIFERNFLNEKQLINYTPILGIAILGGMLGVLAIGKMFKK